MAEQPTCNHCSTPYTAGLKSAVIATLEELSILNKETSKSVQKKAWKRLVKINKRYKIPVLVEGLYAVAAQGVKEEKWDAARQACYGAIQLHGITVDYNNIKSQTVKEILLQKAHVSTNQGLISHVAKRIPCKCLDELYKEAKSQSKLAHCEGCRQDHLLSDMLMCGGCKLELYCSEECKNKDWKFHKSICKALRRESERLAGASKSSTQAATEASKSSTTSTPGTFPKAILVGVHETKHTEASWSLLEAAGATKEDGACGS